MTERRCPVCGCTFLAYHNLTIYCSKECRDKATKNNDVPVGLLAMRRARFERLRHYVDRYDLRIALAKYKPQKTNNNRSKK